ncbi:MAG: hypothetical protein RRY29_07420 [Desulfovibrionaceae bacterium]
MQILLRTFFSALLWAVVACAGPAWAQGEPSVREFFASVPLTLFENTPEGLSDEERQELLELGTSRYWKIVDESQFSLTLESLPFGESVVFVRLFPQKSQGGGQAFVVGAIGTRSTSMCTLEMWREDKNGRMVPEDTPSEPPITDFFTPKTRIPTDVEPTVLICLGAQGLEAMPIFWNASGMAYIPVDSKVYFVWTGTGFEKRVQAHGAE